MLKWLFWAILLVATGSAALSVGRRAARWIDRENTLLATAGAQAVSAIRSAGEAGQTFLSRAGEKEMTLLLTGVDDERNSADAIMSVAVNLEEGSIRVLRINGNIYARREGDCADRIGSVYTAATEQALRQGDSQKEAVRKGNIALKGFLKENMGIAADHYISLNAEGFSAVIESVGGVTVNIPQDIECCDDGRAVHLHLKKGKQQLDGKTAADFIRLGNDGEYEEIDALKLVLSAFLKKVKQEYSLSTAVGLLKASLGNTVSDLTLPDLVPLARGLFGISSASVKMGRLSGAQIADEAGNACEVICRSRAIELIGQYLPHQSGIDEAHFDPHRVFTEAGAFDRLYYSG